MGGAAPSGAGGSLASGGRAGAGAVTGTGGRHGGGTAGTGGAKAVGGGEASAGGGSPLASAGEGGVSEPPAGGVGGSSPGGGDAGAGASANGGSGGGHAGTTGTGGALAGGAPSASGGEGGAQPPVGGASSGEAGAPAEPTPPGLVAFYPCEGASDGALADASGQGNDAFLVDGKAGASPGFAFEDGVVGNALSLSSSRQSHVQLPRGIVSGLQEVTVATWVMLGSNAAFQRILDVGANTDTFMYLANAGDEGLLRFRITSVSPSRNQVLEGGQALPVGSWAHVAVTVGDSGIALYIDGTQVAQQAPAVMRPSDLGDTTNNFIGRSPFAADPYLDGKIDEFRIYDRVLSGAELAALAGR